MNQVKLEKNVIAATLADPESADDLVESINDEHFTDNKMKDIYRWIVKQRNKNKELSIVKLAAETNIKPEDLPEKDLFHEFDDSIELLKKNKAYRDMNAVSRKLHHLTKNKELSLDEFYNKAQEMVFSVTSKTENEKNSFTLGEALMQSYESYIQRREGVNKDNVKSGYYQIDKRFGGFTRGHLTVIAADSSVGKTAFAISIVRNKLVNHEKCAFISLEMQAKEITDRMVVGEARVPMNDYTQNAQKLSETQQKAINYAFNRFDDYEENLYINDKRGMKIDEVLAVCRKAKTNLKELDLLVIDYLQDIALEHKGNKSDELGEIVVKIRALAKQLDVPIILLSQLNRGHNQQGKRPTMANLRGSGEIEETADEIWLLYRPDREQSKTLDNDREKKGPRVLGELIQEKGRTSGTGVCKMYYYEELTRWEDGYEMDTGMKNKIEILRK